MFGHSKYDTCHIAIQRSGADVQELYSLGMELQGVLGQFEASLKSFLFNESGIGWDADKLRDPMRWVINLGPCRHVCMDAVLGTPHYTTAPLSPPPTSPLPFLPAPSSLHAGVHMR